MSSRALLASFLSSTAFALCGCGFTGFHASAREGIREINSPAPAPAFSPRITAMRDGTLILTWLEPANDKFAILRSSMLRDGAWSAPVTIAADQPFSRHPSEAPAVVALSATNLIAYWSQKPPREESASQEVDVYFSVSTDRGLTWSASTLANVAGSGEESSYPSAAPLDPNHAALLWLDGTNWKSQKRVTLNSRTIRSDGSMTPASVLDSDTCTCCPTALAATASGVLAAYRGHTSENIRDISLLQNTGGHWSQPYLPHADNWHFAGCPVNGPHLDVDGATVALVWFSAPNDQPQVQLAFSENGGSHFAPPLRIDQGNVVGRAQAVLLPGNSAFVFWLENKNGATRLLGRHVRDHRSLDSPFEVAHGTDLGYPHAVRAGKSVFVTWASQAQVKQVHVAALPAE